MQNNHNTLRRSEIMDKFTDFVHVRNPKIPLPQDILVRWKAYQLFNVTCRKRTWDAWADRLTSKRASGPHCLYCERTRVCVQSAARCMSARHASCTATVYTLFANAVRYTAVCIPNASEHTRLTACRSLHLCPHQRQAWPHHDCSAGQVARESASCPLVDWLPMSLCLSRWRDVVCAILWSNISTEATKRRDASRDREPQTVEVGGTYSTWKGRRTEERHASHRLHSLPGRFCFIFILDMLEASSFREPIITCLTAVMNRAAPRCILHTAHINYNYVCWLRARVVCRSLQQRLSAKRF